jgi:hypothetical protein
VGFDYYLANADRYDLADYGEIRMRLALGVIVFSIVLLANAIELPGWFMTAFAFTLIALFVSTMKGTRTNVRSN